MKKNDPLITYLITLLLKGQQRQFMRPLRIRLAIAQVEAVKLARNSVMAICLMCLFYIILFSGILLFHVGLFFYLPGSTADRGLIFMILGGFYFLLMLLGMRIALSQKRWMHKSGADKAVIDALRK
jgi:hypothetical protein